MKFKENGSLSYLSDQNQEYFSQVVKFHENGDVKEINSRIYDSIKGYQLDGWSLFFDKQGNLNKKVLYSRGNVERKQEVKSSN